MFSNSKNLVLHVDFQNGFLEKINNVKCKNVEVELTKENIKVVENIVPFRREGKFLCLHHEDEGFVDGKWKKGETTARNEKRLVMEMQQGLIDYKTDGLKNILDILNIDNIDVSLYENTKFINVKIK
jgi:regulatory protein YycI of two-component signal transduction system YycFG